MALLSEIARGLDIMLRAGGDCEMVAEHDRIWAADGTLKLSDEDRAELEHLRWFVCEDIGTWSHHA